MANPPTVVSPHTKWPVAILIGTVASILLAVVVLAFLWPGKTSETRNLPVGLAGPQATVAAFENAVGGDGAFDFVPAVDRAEAVAQIETRQTYGAIVLGAGTEAPEVLTAPAGSAVAAQMLGGVAAQLQAQLSAQLAAAGGDPGAATVTVTSVVPLSQHDPSGAGLASASFPLAIGGILGGVLIFQLVVGAARRLAALAGFTVAAGIVLALIMQTWFQYLQGDFWINALAMGLTMLATSAFIIGCTSLIGKAGIAVGAILTMFVGNPLSGAASPWQFLPEPWGVIGQHMVPGASGSLIRSLSYFPDASNAQQWWTLCVWAAVGIALTLIGHFRSRPQMQLPASTIESPATVSVA